MADACNCNCGKGVIETLAHGATGLARAALRIDRVEPSLKETRLRICLGHPTGGPDALPRCEAAAGVFCSDCKCLLPAKAGDARERCPRGKW